MKHIYSHTQYLDRSECKQALSLNRWYFIQTFVKLKVIKCPSFLRVVPILLYSLLIHYFVLAIVKRTV